MGMNEAETRHHLIDPVLCEKGYVSRDHITLETTQTPAPVEPSGAKGRRRKGQSSRATTHRGTYSGRNGRN